MIRLDVVVESPLGEALGGTVGTRDGLVVGQDVSIVRVKLLKSLAAGATARMVVFIKLVFLQRPVTLTEEGAEVTAFTLGHFSGTEVISLVLVLCPDKVAGIKIIWKIII